MSPQLMQDGKVDVHLRYGSDYNKSTLPHLLTEYGLPNTEPLHKHEHVHATTRKSMKQHKKEANGFSYGEDERMLRRQKERDEHCLKLIQDMQRLRDYYYKLYTQRLKEKVEKQRKEIREKDLLSMEKRAKQKEEEKRASHKLKKRLEYHVLETSDSSINVPKTDLYYIVGLEHKLVREGKLKTINDLNKFRLDIKDPDVFYSTFKVNKSSGVQKYPHYMPRDDQTTSSDTQPLSSDKLSEISHICQTLRSLSQISECRESKPDIFSENTTITQQSVTPHRKRRSLSGVSISRRKLNVQADLDKRFPKVEMPNLHCFSMDLVAKPPDPDEVQQKAELRAKRKQRKQLMQKIAKMYQLAMSNVATSARIFDQHEDMDMVLTGPALCDVIASKNWTQSDKLPGSKKSYQPKSPKVSHEHVKKRTEAEPELERGEPHKVPLSETHSETSASVVGTDEESRHASPEARSLPPALTMEEVVDRNQIMEAKSLSTFWRNYMGAGK